MSLSQIEEVKCPCGEVFVAELWSVINVVTDPPLKDALLGGELNVVRCPRCGLLFYAEHFLLYHDSANELLAFVYPEIFAESEAYWRAKMDEQFERAQSDFSAEEKLSYGPILVFGLANLHDMIRKEDEMEDEIKIVEFECRKRNIPTVKLKPSLARKKNAPRLLPSLSGTAKKESVLLGLDAVLKTNHFLKHYREFFDKLAGSAAPEFEEILSG